ncbi:MAG: hypothetical protein BGN97_00210 [Microbacterium sp. 69-10]|uniref:fibronectin type III domain-containing protein n=1 Tax=Microbacterium sp. 69-10 TaxID=1895783 RepID=UPI00095D46E1|nr:fibronectin type III domain-containing protein [Microbacterium sp. 69-10]OJU39678.1 MAG: hypothetical protein BGN97_00210 [Microbacterium sp. 69-10]
MPEISVSKSSPFVTFKLVYDRYSTNVGANQSTVYAYNQMSKGSGSYFNGAGVQIASIDGVGELGRHSASPFLPSGMTGWNDGPYFLTVNHDGNGNASVTVRMTLTYGNINEAHTAVLTLPTIPQTPSGLTLNRVSDTRIDLSWSKAGTTTSAVVHRQTDDGAWQQVGAPSGNVTSFSDTTASEGHKYRYRVAGVAAAGTSAWSATATVYTSPVAPTGVSATRSGMDIVVKASTVPPFVTGFDVMDDTTVVATNVSLPWTHVAPDPGVPHTYKLRGVAPGGVQGAWSASSNTVQLIAPPAAPVNLAPNGAVRASDAAVRLSWTHNPVDSSAQSAYELQWRPVGGSWTTLTGATAAFRDVSLPLGDVEWQVRTKGTDPAFSPWSAVAVVTVITRPGVAITQPDTDWDASTLTVTWSWFQPEGRPQSSWELELQTAAGTVIEARSGSGATGSFTFTSRLAQGDFKVRARAATGDVMSLWAEQAFTVVFDPPAPPIFLGEWSEENGVVTLTVAPGGIEGPIEVDDLTTGGRVVLWDAVPDTTDVQVVAPLPPAAVRMTVERLSGTRWVPLMDGPAGATFIDSRSPSYADIVYRATGFTAEGAATVTEIIVPARSGALWLSGGAGFMTTCRLPFDPQYTITAGRARASKQFAGRPLPVVLTGEALERIVAVTGSTSDLEDDTASADKLTELAQVPEPLFLFRDPDGRRIFGGIGQIQLGRQGSEWHPDGWNSLWGYSFTLTEATEE